MSNEQKGTWLDEDTYVEEDGTTHKAIPYDGCHYCSLDGTGMACVDAKCSYRNRKDYKSVRFEVVQKVEVDKCK